MSKKEFIALMAMLMSVVAISIDGMLPALGLMGADLAVTHSNQAQYIISMFFIGMAVGQLFNGILSDAYGRRNILFFGFIIYFIGTFICLMAGSLNMMLIGRLIQGFGAAAAYVSVMSIVRDRYVGSEMGKIMSLVMMIFIMTPVIAPSLGQLILFVGTWHYIFVLYAFYAVAVGIWVFFRLEETLPAPMRVPVDFASIKHGTKAVLVNSTTRNYIFVIGLVFGVLIADLNSIQQIFQIQYGLGEWFAVFFGLQAISFGAASYANSRLLEIYSMRRIAIYATSVFFACALLLLIIHYVTAIPFWLYFSFGVVLLFCVGLLFGNLNAIAMEPMGDIAGTAAAIIGIISSLIGIGLGTLVGQLYDGSLLPILCGFTGFGLGALLFILLEARQFTKDQAE